MVRAPRGGADLLVGREEQQEGDPLVELNHLVVVQLVFLGVLR